MARAIKRTLTAEAKRVLSTRGWLSRQPDDVKQALLDFGELHEFEPQTSVNQIGDPRGAVSALVSGWVNVMIAPLETAPVLLHVSGPGAWGGDTRLYLKH